MRCVVSIVLLAVCVLAASPAWSQVKKPKGKDTSQVLSVDGKTLEEWIKLIHGKDRSKAEMALRALLMFPPERAYQAVPDMLQELRRHSADYPIDVSIRVNLAISLGIILANNEKGADPKHVHEAVTLLTRLLRDNQAIVRYRAAEALGNIGTEAKAATTALVPLLRDRDTWEVRRVAAGALAKVAYDPKYGAPVPVLNALYQSLGDTNAQVRLAAIQSLTFIGPPADPTMRLGLMNALAPVAAKDPEPSVEIWANMSLISLNDAKNYQQWLKPIMKFLKHEDPLVRSQAVQALGVIGGSKGKGATPVLIDMLTEPDIPVTLLGSSIWALGRMEGWASDAVEPLQQIAADPKQPEMIKKAAKDSIDSIQGRTKEKDKKRK